MKGSHVIVENVSGIESPISLEEWNKMKDHPEIKPFFKVVREVYEPPEYRQTVEKAAAALTVVKVDEQPKRKSRKQKAKTELKKI